MSPFIETVSRMQVRCGEIAPCYAMGLLGGPATARLRPLLCLYVDSWVAIWYIHAVEAVLSALADDSWRTILGALTGGPAAAGEPAALMAIARPGCRGSYACRRGPGSSRSAGRPSGGLGSRPPPTSPPATPRRDGTDPSLPIGTWR